MDNIVEFDLEIFKYCVNIKEVEVLIEWYNMQFDNVKNNCEYDVLMKELEMQNLEIQFFEKKICGVEKDKECKVEILEVNQECFDCKFKDFVIKKVEFEEIIKKIEKEEQKLCKEVEKWCKKIEDCFLCVYDCICINYCNGLAVVIVEWNVCGGCFNMILLQLQLEIVMQKKIIVCEYCSCILVDDVIVVEVIGEMEVV